MAKLDLALVVRTVDQATGPLRRIQNGVRDLANNRGLQRFRRGAAATARGLRNLSLIGAAAGGAAILFGQKYAESADRIAKTSVRIGITTKELQRLRHAFDIGGASAEMTDRALQFFARSIGEAHKGTGEAVEIFEAMGITLRKQDGTVKTTAELLNEVADGFAAQKTRPRRRSRRSACSGVPAWR